MRKLASIQQIRQIVPIENADKIELAKINGWQSVVEKGFYKENDYVVFIEIDSWVPNHLVPFLSKGKEPREYNGIKGEKIKSVRLKKVLSQGLILPYSVIASNHDGECLSTDRNIGDDVSSLLGITKWEAPISPQLSGVVKCPFPSYVPKTDQPRLQNLVTEIDQYINEKLEFSVEEKLEGSSCTICILGDNVDVCSRNLSLRENLDNTFWKVTIEQCLIEKLKSLNRNLAFQGETCGEGIEGNIYKLKGHKFYLYDIYDIDQARYLYPNERSLIAKQLDLLCVPSLGTIKFDSNTSIDTLLEMADGQSEINPLQLREGLVFKCTNKNITFKAVSNQYLLSN